MHLVRNRTLSLALGALLLIPAGAHATNGMFLIGQGTKARGMGGAGIAFPQDAIAGAMNPAGIGFLENHMRADMSADLFFPSAEAELGGTHEDSQANKFIMPAMGASYRFSRNLTFGFSAVPGGGGGSRYNTNLYNNLTGADADRTLGVNLMLLNMNPTVAYRLSKNHQIGASLVIGVQTFRAFGLDFFSNFTSTGLFTDNLSNNGNDWAYGAGGRVGWMGRFLDEKLSMGLVYTSKTYMTKFDKYKDLFAEKGSFDTPASAGIGFAYEVTPKLTAALDVTHIFYSEVRSIGNTSVSTGGSPFPVSQEQNALGRKDGLGFGWDDQTVYKVGAAYDYNSDWTFRAGWNYGASPVDESNGEILFSIVAPAVTQNHLTLGATYRSSPNMEWNFSYIHAFRFEQEGPTFIGDIGRIQMDQNAFGIGFSFKM